MARTDNAVNIDKQIHTAAKIAAVHEGITLTRLLSEAVTEWLKNRGHPTAITRTTPARPTP